MKKSIPLLILCSILSFSCQEMLIEPEPENTAKNNFGILWKAYDENYPMFEVKKINWDSLHTVYGSKITSTTTESELWNITGELIRHLNDGHVTMFNAGWTKSFSGSKINDRKPDDFSFKVVKDKFLTNIKTAGGGYFIYGTVKPSLSSKNIGYIYIPTFEGSGTNNSAQWAYDISKIVDEFINYDAVIIDVRNNGGGLKNTGWIIASAFIDREITYFYQREKTGPGHNDFGEEIPLTVYPSHDFSKFTKKIAVLTNRFSGSGAEHFAQMFKFLPYSTQIGDSTFGAFGDVAKIEQLPNGWSYRYPCRLTTTPDGKCPEGIGIIPDILVENTKADIDAGRDNVMERAINILSF